MKPEEGKPIDPERQKRGSAGDPGSGLYLTIPFGKTWHVFRSDNRALCGGAMMLHVNPSACVPVTGKEVYRQGQDCKACFRKAGLALAQPQHPEAPETSLREKES